MDNLIFPTETFVFENINYGNFNSHYREKFPNIKNFISSPKYKKVKYMSNQQNNKANNKRIINQNYPNKRIPNYTFQNNESNPNLIFYKNKSADTNNKIIELNNKIPSPPKSKNLFNKIKKEIKMIKLQLTSDILKNKIQLLNNLGNEENESYNYNENFKYNNYYSQNNFKISGHNNINNNKAKKKKFVLNNRNNYYSIPNKIQIRPKNITNANSLKNIYYINNNFRINSIQNNENKHFQIPKSNILNTSPDNYISNPIKQNKVINIPHNMKKYVSTSPDYFSSKSALYENNNFKHNSNNNNILPKSFVNILLNKNINNSNNNNKKRNIIKMPSKSIQINNKLPKGYFDDYLISSRTNQNLNVNQNKKEIIYRNNKSNNNYIINNNINNNNKKNDIKNKINNIIIKESKSTNEFKIENYNSFFINNAKKQKNRILQTENKIVDFSYFGSSNIKSENSTNKNKVINTINFSFNPTKIVFNNNSNNNNNNIIKNKEQNKGNEENENNNKEQSNNKNLASLIEPCELEEKSIILENSIPEKEESNIIKKQNKLSFDDTKIIVKYNQDDYIRNYNLLYKTKINNEKDKKNEENKCEKISHKFISTTKLCDKLKKKNKNLKSNLNKNNKINHEYNPNVALKKLNDLIFDDSPTKPKKENDNNKNPKDIKNTNNKSQTDIIKKNINFIKKLEECNKKGINYRSLTLSKREINLLNKKKKNLGFKFKNNSQNLLSEKLRENALKSFQKNVDDNELLKINKNRIIYDFEKEKIKEDYNDNNEKLNNSFS